FVPDDSTQPSYAGKFTAWFGDENNLRNEVEHETFRVKLLGTDGSVLMAHETAHMGTSASGLSFSFDKIRFACPWRSPHVAISMVVGSMLVLTSALSWWRE